MRKGYTSIELLTTMSIIAIMGTSVLPSYRALQDEAKTTKAQAEVKTVQAVVENYRHNYGALPISLNKLKRAKDSILNQDCYDPFTNELYKYELLGNDNYVVYSAGSNGLRDFEVDAGRVLVRGDDIVVSNLSIEHL